MGKRFDKFWHLAAVLFAIALAMYAKSWNYGLTFLDDRDVIVQKSQLLAEPRAFIESFTQTYFANVTQVYYRPIVNLSFVLDARFGGVHPFVYHLTNGLLHGCACVLMFGLLWQLKCGKWPSFAAALCFAVHPINVPSVAWIPGRNDVLLGCFALGALLLLLRALHRPSLLAVAGHAACFTAALFTKETAIILPVVFIGLIAATSQWQRQLRRPALAALWVSSIGVYCVARSFVTKTPAGYFGKALHSSWEHRWVLLSDIGKLLMPVRLQVMATEKDVLLWPGAVVVLLVGTSLLLPSIRRRIVYLAMTLMLATLFMSLLASDFILLENRLYLAIAGMCLWLAELLRAASDAGAKRLAAVLWCGLTLVFAGRALRYCDQFRDEDSYSRAAIEASPGSYLAMRLRFARTHSGHGRGPARPALPTAH